MKIRLLRWRDIRTTWRLASDPMERSQARDPSMPTVLGHLRWMLKRMDKHNKLNHAWVLFQDTGEPMGMVRADSHDGETEISAVLFPAYRGRGTGSRAIRMIASGLASRPEIRRITAYIKSYNRPSRQAFKKAGFVLTGPTKDGMDKLLYMGGKR